MPNIGNNRFPIAKVKIQTASAERIEVFSVLTESDLCLFTKTFVSWLSVKCKQSPTVKFLLFIKFGGEQKAVRVFDGADGF